MIVRRKSLPQELMQVNKRADAAPCDWQIALARESIFTDQGQQAYPSMEAIAKKTSATVTVGHGRHGDGTNIRLTFIL